VAVPTAEDKNAERKVPGSQASNEASEERSPQRHSATLDMRRVDLWKPVQLTKGSNHGSGLRRVTLGCLWRQEEEARTHQTISKLFFLIELDMHKEIYHLNHFQV
jgi:hypothetical protein